MQHVIAGAPIVIWAMRSHAEPNSHVSAARTRSVPNRPVLTDTFPLSRTPACDTSGFTARAIYVSPRDGSKTDEYECVRSPDTY